MSGFINPFLQAKPLPGSGEIHVRLLPPHKVTLGALSFTYPLKLIPSTPHTLRIKKQQEKDTDGSSQSPHSLPSPDSVPLIFLLSYGGGLLPPDSIDLRIRLDAGTRLTIATQGNTKIYPSRPRDPGQHGTNRASQPAISSSPSSPPPPSSTTADTPPSASTASLPTAQQTIRARLAAHSALCLLPDPNQPFRESKYAQLQSFSLHAAASLLLLDWTVEGRRARGESWDALLWRGCNEIWRERDEGDDDSDDSRSSSDDDGESETKPKTSPNGVATAAAPAAAETWPVPGARLQLRDAVILEADDYHGDGASGRGMRALKDAGAGCFGTLIAVGPLVAPVGDFFVDEFGALPRVGAPKWDDEDNDEAEAGTDADRFAWRQRRLALERDGAVLWSAARVRGAVVCKFMARDLQSARRWLNEMLVFEGTTEREFGPGGLMSLR